MMGQHWRGEPSCRPATAVFRIGGVLALPGRDYNIRHKSLLNQFIYLYIKSDCAESPPQEELRVPLLCSTGAFSNVLGADSSLWFRPETPTMPGIRFAKVRATIPMADVLDLVGFVPCETSGDQVRGPCPVHQSTAPTSRSFSANLKRHVYRCFTCGSSGNQLDLYASVTGLTLFEAAVALCEQLHREIPWMESAKPNPVQGRQMGRRS